MRLAFIELCGFRGYRHRLHLDFPSGFTIIDGRNGAGKSTIFDAVEFALTGTISKYGNSTEDNETIGNYIWWSAEGAAPSERYVEVGFTDDTNTYSVRRSEFGKVDPATLAFIRGRLCDESSCPESPLSHLCASSLIRDEQISALSLDLGEAKRYSMVLEAIGATDAEKWIDRGAALARLSKRRTEVAQAEVEAAAREVSSIARRVDQLRAALVEESIIANAAERLRAFSGSAESPDRLAEPARAVIAVKEGELEQLVAVGSTFQQFHTSKQGLAERREALESARRMKEAADKALAALPSESASVSTDSLAQQARDLGALLDLGKRIGILDGHCPLCVSPQTTADFERGLAWVEARAKELDLGAFEEAKRGRAYQAALATFSGAQAEVDRCSLQLETTESAVNTFEARLLEIGLKSEVTIEELRERHRSLSLEIKAAREDLRIIETLRLNSELASALREHIVAKGLHASSERRLGITRRAQSHAQALHDSARRAAGEVLDQRLERVVPLMAELYSRLRPHPVWRDLEYKIRGDVKRFLKFQVGHDLNPQFMFSSGQRRATGLAFLIAVNLSLSWSRWQTTLLDDPVQHIDDFRSIQLAEVLAQLSKSGRQIICAVEDAALADLLCRRLPIDGAKTAKRVTLGPDGEGELTKLHDEHLEPLPEGVLATGFERLAS